MSLYVDGIAITPQRRLREAGLGQCRQGQEGRRQGYQQAAAGKARCLGHIAITSASRSYSPAARIFRHRQVARLQTASIGQAHLAIDLRYIGSGPADGLLGSCLVDWYRQPAVSAWASTPWS